MPVAKVKVSHQEKAPVVCVRTLGLDIPGEVNGGWPKVNPFRVTPIRFHRLLETRFTLVNIALASIKQASPNFHDAWEN